MSQRLPTEEHDAVKQAEEAISRLPTPRPVSRQILEQLWAQQTGQSSISATPKLVFYMKQLGVSFAILACTTIIFFVYQNYAGDDAIIHAGFAQPRPLGPQPPIKTLEPFRAAYLRASGTLDYTISYQAKENSVDVSVYLLRQGPLNQGIPDLVPTQKNTGELVFQKAVNGLLNPSNAGALQYGWQKLIIVLAPKGRQPSTKAILEGINAPLSKKPRKWTFLEHEINIVE